MDEYRGIDTAHLSGKITISAESGDSKAIAVGGISQMGAGGEVHGAQMMSSLIRQLDQTMRKNCST